MNKQYVLVDLLTPAFAQNFHCLGADCPEHCCHSWQIIVDKKSYKQLKKHGDIEIRELAGKSLKLTRNSDSNYAEIRLDDDGNCQLLDENSLCRLHKKCGHEALPHTCQQYPRLPQHFGKDVEMSLSLSCFGVAEQVLFDPNAMAISETKARSNTLNHGKIGGLNANALPGYLPVIRDFCFNIALRFELLLEFRLFVIGLYLKQSEDHLDNPLRLVQLAESFYAMLDDGSLADNYQSIPAVPALKWYLFSNLDAQLMRDILASDLNAKQRLRSQGMFISCQKQLMNCLQPEQGVSNVPYAVSFCDTSADGSRFQQVIAEAEEKYLNQYFADHPEVMNNFLLYSLYHDQFLVKKGATPFGYLKLLVSDILLLRSYLAGIALQQDGIDKAWIVKLFQSYSRRRQHVPEFLKTVTAQLDKLEQTTPGAIFALLK